MMSVTELDKMYWDLYGAMLKNKDRKSYRDYCEIGGEIMKEMDRRGLVTPGDVADAIKEEKMLYV